MKRILLENRFALEYFYTEKGNYVKIMRGKVEKNVKS